MLACKATACVALARPGVDMPCAGQHVTDHCLSVRYALFCSTGCADKSWTLQHLYVVKSSVA